MSAALEAPASVDEPLFEIIDGQRVELTPMGARESLLANYLTWLLNNSAIASIGMAACEVLFDLQIGRNRRPDSAIVRYDRWPRSQPVPPGNAWVVVPNLAVEIVSPTDLADELFEKLTDYFRAGVELVWVIYPRQRMAYVYTSLKEVRGLDEHDALDGGNVIPGFTLSLATLFCAEGEPAE
jgi:Uma2 family endonuclease